MIQPSDFQIQPGESAGEFLVRIVRAYAGKHPGPELSALIGRGVPGDEHVDEIPTDCATFSLGILVAALGGHDAAAKVHSWFVKSYAAHYTATDPNTNIQQVIRAGAIAWLIKIGSDLGAVIPVPSSLAQLKPGTLFELANPDHVEWFLAPPGLHGGAGRAGNAVTVDDYGPADWLAHIRSRAVRCFDPDKWGIKTLPAEDAAPRSGEVQAGLPVEGNVATTGAA